MFTNKIENIYIAYDERDKYVYEIGFKLYGSSSRRGSLRVIYNLDGSYIQNNHDLKFYPLTKNNIEIVKKIELLFQLKDDLKKIKLPIDFAKYSNDIKINSISSAIEKRAEDSSTKLLISIDNELITVGDQDISNRKKNWFFINGVSTNLKDHSFYIGFSKEEIQKSEQLEKEYDKELDFLKDVQSKANEAYKNSLTERMWSLYLDLDMNPNNPLDSVNISEVLGEDKFLSEKIDDIELSLKMLEYLKKEKVWLGGRFVDISLAKNALDIDTNLYGAYSDRKDAIYEEDFIDLIFHNKKAYEQLKLFLNNK